MDANLLVRGELPATRRGQEWFPDEKIMAIVNALSITQLGKLRHLAFVLRRLPETVDSFRAALEPPSPSATARRLSAFKRTPESMLAAAMPPRKRSVEALRLVLKTDYELALLFYQFADLLEPKRRAEGCIADGTAHRAFLDTPRQLPRIRIAARNAAALIRSRVRTGKGGDRRSERVSVTDAVIDHLLGVYADVTGSTPGITVKSAELTCQVGGRAVDFLVACLDPTPIKASRATLRRRIEEYRKEAMRKH
jgi:hypothetical protein